MSQKPEDYEIFQLKFIKVDTVDLTIIVPAQVQPICNPFCRSNSDWNRRVLANAMRQRLERQSVILSMSITDWRHY